MAEKQWVQMTHPSLAEKGHKPATVTEQSYNETWKPQGWKLYTPKKEN